jgi:hypothetical protein
MQLLHHVGMISTTGTRARGCVQAGIVLDGLSERRSTTLIPDHDLISVLYDFEWPEDWKKNAPWRRIGIASSSSTRMLATRRMGQHRPPHSPRCTYTTLAVRRLRSENETVTYGYTAGGRLRGENPLTVIFGVDI